MKGKFAKYLSGKDWLIFEKDWPGGKPGVAESLFTLGNGYLGSRGIYEEIPEGTEPGTYIAGVYDSAASMVPELVNAPNPIDFRIIVEGEKLDIGRMNVVENERILDMGKGFILRRTVFSDTKKRRFLYESLRFFSLSEPHIGAMQVYLKALDKPAKIIVQDTVDDSVTNLGSLLEGRKRHTQLVGVSTSGDINYLCVKTFTRKIWIAYASFLAVARGLGQGVGTLNRIFNMSVKKGETVCFTKIFSVRTSKHTGYPRLKKTTINNLARAKNVRFKNLLKQHTRAWQEKWKNVDIKIEGDRDLQKALRFNMYHLLIAGKTDDENVSISARTLSGNGYHGHIFWDTEIFILPFFIYTDPGIARNLLMYRFSRLNRARVIARENGYKGVLFPWESADTGVDVTPPYAKNLDGTIIEIHTGSKEHHITSDVAYGVLQYFHATEDVEFMKKAGCEILFETARFWASRVARGGKRKLFEIKNVIGPDEFHEGVDNNAYTNVMAKWNLYSAKALYDAFGRKYPRFLKGISGKIALKPEEAEGWVEIADKIKVPFSESKGIIEEFDGYLRKKDIVLDELNRFFMPILPKNVPLKDIERTQIVKQADVLMLMYLLPDLVGDEEKARNYLYYVKRTLHKSSLSPSIYSIIASEVGDATRGYLYFLFSAYADLGNMHGNTPEGIHAASLGGTWQAAVCGFAGFRLAGGMPSFEPRLPSHWRNMEFCLKWKGQDLKIRLNNKKIEFFAISSKKGNVIIKAFNSVYKIPFNKKTIILNKKKR
ncbi:MAG: glycoside hydrolase family 65 protein [Omnitrophica bacterium]|nr:glycoside hydrolase family 65 protein [Candidatus Omnitrophota bacterium]